MPTVTRTFIKTALAYALIGMLLRVAFAAVNFVLVLAVLLPAYNADAWFQHRAYTTAQAAQPVHDHAAHDHGALQP